MILTFDGTLTVADHKAHVPVAFDVPPGMTRLAARFSDSPDRASGALFDNLISAGALAYLREIGLRSL
jgi:hypothetical protein